MTVIRRFLPTLPRFEPESLDSTATKELKTCKRKYFYRMVLGRTKPEGKWEAVFAWGTSIHTFLEVLYRTGDVKLAIEAGLPLFKSPLPGNFEFQTRERWMKTIALLVQFYERERELGYVKVHAIEQPFSLAFPDDRQIGGRYDQLIEQNGLLSLRDWKTTSKQFEWFAHGLKPNDQGIRYFYSASVLKFGADENFYPKKLIDSVIFQAIYNAKSVGPQLRAFPIRWNMGEVINWIEDQRLLYRELDACREADRWPMEETNCGFCEYREVCDLGSDAAREQMLRMNYLLSPWKHENVTQEKGN